VDLDSGAHFARLHAVWPVADGLPEPPAAGGPWTTQGVTARKRATGCWSRGLLRRQDL